MIALVHSESSADEEVVQAEAGLKDVQECITTMRQNARKS